MTCLKIVEEFHALYLKVKNNAVVPENIVIKSIKEDPDTYDVGYEESNFMFDVDIKFDNEPTTKPPIDSLLIFFCMVHMKYIYIIVLGLKKSKQRKKSTATKTKRTKKSVTNREDLKKYFNMYCELCNYPIRNLTVAVEHYRQEHDQVGYMTCCDKKFFKENRIMQHCMWHENPEAFK